MKREWIEYWVEYDFIDTKWGRRPMYIRQFGTKSEADEFASTTADGEVHKINASTII